MGSYVVKNKDEIVPTPLECPVTIITGLRIGTHAGISVLHAASQGGHPEIVRLCLEGGLAIDARAQDGRTALCQAALSGQFSTLEHLLAAGADVSLVDNQHRNVLFYAIASKKYPLVMLQYLLNLPDVTRDLDIKTIDDQNLVDFALQQDSLDCAQYLQSLGLSATKLQQAKTQASKPKSNKSGRQVSKKPPAGLFASSTSANKVVGSSSATKKEQADKKSSGTFGGLKKGFLL